MNRPPHNLPIEPDYDRLGSEEKRIQMIKIVLGVFALGLFVVWGWAVLNVLIYIANKT